MSLTDFFRINLPYGMNKNLKGKWMFFNREYVPLGWNESVAKENLIHNGSKTALPIYTGYKGLTDAVILKKFGQGDQIIYDEDGKVIRVFFYNDRTNPTNNKSTWEQYFDILQWLSKFQIKQ